MQQQNQLDKHKHSSNNNNNNDHGTSTSNNSHCFEDDIDIQPFNNNNNNDDDTTVIKDNVEEEKLHDSNSTFIVGEEWFKSTANDTPKSKGDESSFIQAHNNNDNDPM